MRTLSLPSCLLLLAFMAGQGLLLAHGFEHQELDAQLHACQICAHGQPDLAAPADVDSPQPSAGPVAQLRASGGDLGQLATHRAYQIRAPPISV